MITHWITNKKAMIGTALATLVAFFLGATVLFRTPVYASDVPYMLQVSPTKQKLELNPGDSYSGTFEVMNVGQKSFTYSVGVSPYQVQGEEYAADYNTENAYTQIADWITFDPDTATGSIDPNETIEVGFTVNVPEDVPSGGQYAALMAETEAGNEEDATIQVVNRVGTILYATIPGNTRESGEILKNRVPRFLFNPPLSVTSLVKNSGNVEVTAYYTFKIWPLFSNETIYDNSEKQGRADLLPETTRATTISWDGAPRLGIYRVEQTVELLDQTSTVKKIVIICPLWLLFLILLGIFFIIFTLVSRSRNRKKNGRK